MTRQINNLADAGLIGVVAFILLTPKGMRRGQGEAKPWPRRLVYWLSRSIICTVVSASIGSLFLTPSNLFQQTLDIVIRTYLMFLGTVMAHEGTHGHLGRSKTANFWWGRLALLPTMVPFTNFRKTHPLHHLHTNIPDQDPDHFMKPRHWAEIPLRALAMPHQWFFWLRRRDRVRKEDLVELVLNYLGIFAVYGVLLSRIGLSRFWWGMLPPLILVSLLLWYPFALKTHEGFSTGTPESRSHNYYGHLIYWFSLGLSMHRVHHLRPGLAWIELKNHVERAPGSLGNRWPPIRDIRPDTQQS